MTTLTPVGDRVVLAVLDSDRVTASGLHTVSKNSPHATAQVGLVLAVGSGQPRASGERREMPVQIGDIVFYPQHITHAGAIALDYGGHRFVILSAGDILAAIPAAA